MKHLNKKTSTKKGFTLVELLVAMAVSSLLLSTLTYLTISIIQLNNEILVDSKTQYQIKVLMNYVQKNYQSGDDVSLIAGDGVYYTKDGESVANRVIEDENEKLQSVGFTTDSSRNTSLNIQYYYQKSIVSLSMVVSLGS